MKGIPLSVKGNSRLSPCSVCPPQNYSKSRLSARYRSFLVPTVQFCGCNSCKNRHRVALLTLQLNSYSILVRFMLHDLSLSTPPPPPLPRKNKTKNAHTHTILRGVLLFHRTPNENEGCPENNSLTCDDL